MKETCRNLAAHSTASKRRVSIPLSLGLLFAAWPFAALAGDGGGKNVLPFSTALVRIEVNATDGDSGFHALIDAEGWKFVKIFDPNSRLIFEVEGGGSVRKTGLTELAFEGAEPGFEDLPLDEFLERFPAGEYRFYGKTIEGDILFSRAILTHALPQPPLLLSPVEDSVQDPNNTVVAWAPPPDPPGSRITRFEVIVSDETVVPTRVFSATVPVTVTSITVSPSFLLPGVEYKYEVLAIEEGGNQTLAESSFQTAP